MEETKRKKDEKQELDSQVTFHDAKGNKIMVGGSINGFAVRHVKFPKNIVGRDIGISGRVSGLDRSWRDKKVLVILLEESATID